MGWHDGVKHGWRQTHDSPISAGGDQVTPGRWSGSFLLLLLLLLRGTHNSKEAMGGAGEG